MNESFKYEEENIIKDKDLTPDLQLKRINLIAFPQRIKDLTEWNVFKEELDERISTELGPGDEVELS